MSWYQPCALRESSARSKPASFHREGRPETGRPPRPSPRQCVIRGFLGGHPQGRARRQNKPGPHEAVGNKRPQRQVAILFFFCKSIFSFKNQSTFFRGVSSTFSQSIRPTRSPIGPRGDHRTA